MTGSIRNKVRGLVLFSSITVALAFGLSFYFALVWNQSAISGRYPELLPVVSKLKGLLVLNTFGFTVIIIASFIVLSHLVTSRIFKPLGKLQKDITTIARNRMPHISSEEAHGPFAGLERSFASAVSVLYERELKDIKTLEKSHKVISSFPGNGALGEEIRAMIDDRRARLDMDKPDNRLESGSDTRISGEDTVFMQPS